MTKLIINKEKKEVTGGWWWWSSCVVSLPSLAQTDYSDRELYDTRGNVRELSKIFLYLCNLCYDFLRGEETEYRKR